MPAYSRFLIKNANIITGDNTPCFKGMAAVEGSRIIYVGADIPFECEYVVDAEGLNLSPGFIDVHGHSDFSILLYPEASSKLLQGVTTEISGNCGLSSSPLYETAYNRWAPRWERNGLNVTWRTPKDYFSVLEHAEPAINFLPLLGHTNVRTAIKGYHSGTLDADELAQFKDVLNEALINGFYGISLGLAYPPGIFAHETELSVLFDAAARHVIPVTVHMRDEGPEVEEALDDMIRLAEKSGAALQVSHLKAYGTKNWHKAKLLCETIQAHHDKGLNIHFDRYPYTAFNTDLDIILPQALFDGGHEKALSRLQERKDELAIYLSTRFSYADAEKIIISDCVDEDCIGKPLPAIIGAERGAIFWKQVIEFICAVKFDVFANFFLMNDEELVTITRHPLCIIASDSSVRPMNIGRERPHPRTYGTFPRFLCMVLADNIISAEEAVYKMTGLPARKFGIPLRGLIKEGYYADLVLWDQRKIADRAAYSQPAHAPDGIRAVWVNGRQAVSDGKQTGIRAGKLLLKR
ncbi:MAG: amidohydrolase family protein [Candidatus Auribacterota bacterium]